MVFTIVQTMAVFEENIQMGLSAHTHAQLQIEGVAMVIDMGEF